MEQADIIRGAVYGFILGESIGGPFNDTSPRYKISDNKTSHTTPDGSTFEVMDYPNQNWPTNWFARFTYGDLSHQLLQVFSCLTKTVYRGKPGLKINYMKYYTSMLAAIGTTSYTGMRIILQHLPSFHDAPGKLVGPARDTYEPISRAIAAGLITCYENAEHQNSYYPCEFAVKLCKITHVGSKASIMSIITARLFHLLVYERALPDVAMKSIMHDILEYVIKSDELQKELGTSFGDSLESMLGKSLDVPNSLDIFDGDKYAESTCAFNVLPAIAWTIRYWQTCMSLYTDADGRPTVPDLNQRIFMEGMTKMLENSTVVMRGINCAVFGAIVGAIVGYRELPTEWKNKLDMTSIDNHLSVLFSFYSSK